MSSEVLEMYEALDEAERFEVDSLIQRFMAKKREGADLIDAKETEHKAALQELFDWAQSVHSMTHESWTRSELYNRGLK